MTPEIYKDFAILLRAVPAPGNAEDARRLKNLWDYLEANKPAEEEQVPE